MNFWSIKLRIFLQSFFIFSLIIFLSFHSTISYSQNKWGVPLNYYFSVPVRMGYVSSSSNQSIEKNMTFVNSGSFPGLNLTDYSQNGDNINITYKLSLNQP